MLWPLLAAVAAAAAAAAATLLRFLRADADLALLARRDPPSGAFEGKVVWIVGASQGLGETLALHWARRGARLVLSARSRPRLAAVAARCAAHVPPGSVEVLPLDVTGAPAELAAAVEAAYAAFDGAGVDYLVLNAGASQHAAAEDTGPEVAAALLALNLEGPLALAAVALPRMLGRGRGRFVVVSSMAGVVPSPGQAAYAAAKAGLRGYFRTVSSELAGRGVGATLVCPGPMLAADAGDAEQGGSGGGRPRMVYGPGGLAPAAAGAGGSGKGKVAQQRAAALIARAAYHGLDEAWIARHPVLLLGYLMQYLPWLGMLVLKRVGPARVRALREGRSGYDAAALVRASGSTG